MGSILNKLANLLPIDIVITPSGLLLTITTTAAPASAASMTFSSNLHIPLYRKATLPVKFPFL